MPYTQEQLDKLAKEYEKVYSGLRVLFESTVLAGSQLNGEGVREYLLHGVGRRLGVIKKTIENVFQLFPPEMDRPLDRETIYDVQINIHAYVMNVSGIFDNWAWAFVLRHGLLEEVGGRHGVGMFRKDTKQFLPLVLTQYIDDRLETWHEDYLKSYRDALAHRIPLYIPPANYTDLENERYEELEKRIVESIGEKDWETLEKLEREQDGLGSPAFVFLHSFNEARVTPIYFHPQLLADGNTIVEYGSLFMDNWHERA